jgi:N-methylhydantoinase B/oxoprolinase/acetone carboxylase alpha subunit
MSGIAGSPRAPLSPCATTKPANPGADLPAARLQRGSGGAGRAPAGKRIERDLQVLADCTVSVITERRVSRPWGQWGGYPGPPGESSLLPARRRVEVVEGVDRARWNVFGELVI